MYKLLRPFKTRFNIYSIFNQSIVHMKFHIFKVLICFKGTVRMITRTSIFAYPHLLFQCKKQVFLMDFLIEHYLRRKYRLYYQRVNNAYFKILFDNKRDYFFM